jgi:flagellar protein FliO/FliZ
MLDSLFGAEMPLAVRFFLAFLIVLGLIGAIAWAVRRFGTGRLGANSRGRQPRLAVIDHAAVDGRRRLILVRRDNVEHLLMIGGPTDVVVEPNIVRAVAAPRDVPAGRPTAGLEALPRAIPLPDNGSNGSWPLQPEPVAPRPLPRVEPLPDDLPPPRSLQPLQPAQPSLESPPPRPQRDTLSALADELSTRPSPPRSRPAPFMRPQPAGPDQESIAESRQEPRHEPRQEPRQEPRAEPRFEPRKPSAPPAPAAAAPPPSPPAAMEAESAADQSLADMAQRLEAALRKPGAATESRAPSTPPRAAPAPEQSAPTTAAPPPRPPRPTSEPKPPRTEAKPAESKTALYDSLEQEMASLLGRPPKT